MFMPLSRGLDSLAGVDLLPSAMLKVVVLATAFHALNSLLREHHDLETDFVHAALVLAFVLARPIERLLEATAQQKAADVQQPRLGGAGPQPLPAKRRRPRRASARARG